MRRSSVKTLAIGESADTLRRWWTLHELDGFCLRLQRRDAYRFERVLELASLGVGERRCVCLADRRGALRHAHGRNVTRGRVDERVHDAHEVPAATLMGLAVALDQMAEPSDFGGEREIGSAGTPDCGEPPFDQLLLVVKTRSAAAQRPEPCERTHEQIPRHAGRLHVHADVERLALARGPVEDAACEAARQYRGEFFDARFQELDDVHGLVRLRKHFRADTLESAAARLEVGDSDDVFVAHPKREIACGLVRDAVSGRTPTGVTLGGNDQREAVQIEIGVSRVLIVHEPRYALFDDAMCFGRKFAPDTLDGPAAPDLSRLANALRRRTGCMRITGRESAQARFRALTVGANRILAGRA